MPFSCLIVDDEPLARAGLRELLEREPDFGPLFEASDGARAIEAISSRAPDLVFLDVQMPEVDGFGVVAAIGADRMPATVFVTAHDEHAIAAFEINALDYLLKPVTSERFARTLARVRERLGRGPREVERHQLVSLLEALVQRPSHLSRLAVRSAGRTRFVEVDDVDWIGAAENYVELHVGPERHLLHVPLQTLERSLDPARFVRIHRSTIVAVSRIAALEAGLHGEYEVVLKDGTRLGSGRTYADRLRALASNPF